MSMSVFCAIVRVVEEAAAGRVSAPNPGSNVAATNAAAAKPFLFSTSSPMRHPVRSATPAAAAGTGNRLLRSLYNIHPRWTKQEDSPIHAQRVPKRRPRGSDTSGRRRGGYLRALVGGE